MRPGTYSRVLRAQAYQIIAAAGPGTNQDEFVWAVGTVTMGFSGRVWQLRHGQICDVLGGGGTIGTGRLSWYDAKGYQVYTTEWPEGPDAKHSVRRVHASTTWAPVIAMIRDAQVPQRLWDDIEAIMARRRAAIPEYVPGKHTPYPDDWAEIEHLSEDAGARVWGHVRPAEQLDLFDLLAVPA